jgi:hypothetical protein
MKIHKNRLPASFFDHIDTRGNHIKLVGRIGSQKLIEYFLVEEDGQYDRDAIFRELCFNNHLPLARRLYGLVSVDIHSQSEEAFREACREGHLSVAEWLYNLGEVNIHVRNDHVFRGACEKGHLSI